MRFPATHRIRRQSDFSRLRAEGSRFDCGSFVLNAVPADSTKESREFPRFGVIASKKMVSNRAVVRNRAKRVFRQIFRSNPGIFPAGWDVIVIARRTFSAQTVAELTVRYLNGARKLVEKITSRERSTPLPKTHEK